MNRLLKKLFGAVLFFLALLLVFQIALPLIVVFILIIIGSKLLNIIS